MAVRGRRMPAIRESVIFDLIAEIIGDASSDNGSK
jgi:hypothetical protein